MLIQLTGEFVSIAQLLYTIGHSQLRPIAAATGGVRLRDVQRLLENISRLEAQAANIMAQIATNPAAGAQVAEAELASIPGNTLDFAGFTDVMQSMQVTGQAFTTGLQRDLSNWDIQLTFGTTPRKEGQVTVETMSVAVDDHIPAAVIDRWTASEEFTGFFADIQAAGG